MSTPSAIRIRILLAAVMVVVLVSVIVIWEVVVAPWPTANTWSLLEEISGPGLTAMVTADHSSVAFSEKAAVPVGPADACVV